MDDSYNEFHDYEIRWTPDEVKWIVDNNEKTARVTKRSGTYNSTSRQYEFPQTPSRVQLSIWPAGQESNAKGTIDWAGGKIDWNSDEIKEFGYYFATFEEVKVECYKTDTAPGTNKGTSYYYNDISATNNTVVDSKKKTVLKSLLGTGRDMDKGDDKSDDGGVHAVPGGGVTGNAPGGGATQGHTGEDSDSGSGSGSGGGSSAGPDRSGCDPTKFSQNCNADSNAGGNPSGNDGVRGAERTLGASAFAGIIGIAGLLFL